MNSSTTSPRLRRWISPAVLCGTAGLLVGALASQGITAMSPPSEHQGLTVEALGVVPESSMEATIGLTGHKLQLRAITIAPGGQIAAHSHATRPGLVKVISGTWTEGRPAGEDGFDAARAEAIIEDENTEHWFFNRGDTPATAIVCDIVPAA
jgi:quercetin dioxygenase-like cupin family protein